MKTDLQKNGWRKKAVLFLVSQCITLFGSTLVQMAVVWYVTLETGSGVWVSAVSVSSYLPQFLISFPGGVWADRYHRKRLIIGADTATAAATLLMICLLPLLKGNGETGEGLVLAGLLLMSALRSAGAGIQTPAVSAVISQLVPETELLRFNGANAAMQAWCSSQPRPLPELCSRWQICVRFCGWTWSQRWQESASSPVCGCRRRKKRRAAEMRTEEDFGDRHIIPCCQI